MTRDPAVRRFVVLVLVAAIHALLLIIARSPVINEARQPEVHSRSSVLFFREIMQAAPTAVSVEPRIREDRRRNDVDGDAVNAPPTMSDDAPSVEAQRPPSIDWKLHATQAATAVVAKAISQEKRKCDPGPEPNTFLPRCTPPEHEFDWNPEPPTVAFSGGLPYVHVGEYCVVGLGFFACALGKPEANGQLFEHMREPDRDRSSVPEP